MIIDLREIQGKQSEFINYLEGKPGVINPKSSFNVTKGQAIKLISKLMQVCNEIKIQKWWDKPDIDKENLIEELADLLAYICDVSNYTGVELVSEIEVTLVEDLEAFIMAFVSDVVLLSNSNNKAFIRHGLLVILGKFIQLVYNLGFSIEELIEAYNKKLKINYTRF